MVDVVYRYRKPDGAIAYTIHRTPDKRFKTAGDVSVRYPFELERLLEVCEYGGTVWVVEGEKDCLSLLDAIDIDGWPAFTATTSSHGASWTWSTEFVQWFRGAQVAWVIADNDEPGRRAAAQRAQALATVVPTVTVLGAIPGLPEHGDVSDYLATGAPLNDLARWCAGAPQMIAPRNGRASFTLTELLERNEPTHDWLVPGLVERTERIMITGDEGYGKSTLLRQLAVAAAMGTNSLAGDELATHKPLTVLLVDLENSERHLMREFRKLMGAVPELHQTVVGGRVHLVVDTAGYVLDDPRDKDGDRARVIAQLDEHKPDLFVIGPLYKMMGGDPNEEKTTREIPRWIDYLRGKYGCAVMIEAHKGHGQNLWPSGWSGWKRWADVGFHLAESGALKAWRGQRDERAWPAQLVRGTGAGGSHGWLWQRGVPEPPGTADSGENVMLECELEVLRALRLAGRRLPRGDILERVDRRKQAVLVAINRLRDRGALEVSYLEVVNARGERRPVEHFTVRADLDPERAVPEDDAPKGREVPEPGALLHLPPRGGEDESDIPPDDE